MNDEKRTDYKTSTPKVLYEARKIVIKMWKKDHPVKEIAEVTGFSTNTVYITIRKYKANAMQALKPLKRGIKAGGSRTLSSEQEKAIIKMITEKNPNQRGSKNIKRKWRCFFFLRIHPSTIRTNI